MTRLLLNIFVFIWLLSVCFGFSMLWSYEFKPGRPVSFITQWPSASRLPRPSDRAMLVVLAHPRCPCTRAAISELARLMAHCRPRLVAYVLFFKPKNTPPDWEKTDLYARAASIPGVHVARDEGGVEARCFHAATSGQTLLFDAHGRMLFSGGITDGRGHEGDSAGQAAVLEGVFHPTQVTRHTPVFGCSLFETASS